MCSDTQEFFSSNFYFLPGVLQVLKLWIAITICDTYCYIYLNIYTNLLDVTIPVLSIFDDNFIFFTVCS